MRWVAALVVLMAATACATPTLTYQSMPAEGNVDGRMVAALPIARITITPPAPIVSDDQMKAAEQRRQTALTATAHTATPHGGGGDTTTDAAGNDRATASIFAVTYRANPHATFLVRPQTDAFSTTQLAPTYRTDSSIVSTLSVGTVDHRAELAGDVAGIISAFGDATFLSSAGDSGRPENSITCGAIEPGYLAWLINKTANGTLSATDHYPARNDHESDADYRSRLARATAADRFEADAAHCNITVSLSAPDGDAITLDYFEHHVLGQQSHLMISAACRWMSVQYTVPGNTAAHNQIIVENFAVPDPFFVRVSPLPYSGKLDASSVCAAPSLTQGDQSPQTPWHTVHSILTPFQNGSGASDGGTTHTGGSK